MATTTNPRDAITAARAALTSANVLQFPATNGAYCSRFSFVAYSRSNPKFAPTTISSTAEIILPLPFNLKEQYTMNYSGANLSWVESGIETMKDIMGNGGTITGEDTNIAGQGLAAMARSAFPNNILSQNFDVSTGTVVNPHLVNVFQGVNLRHHHFSWELSPTSTAEAQTLQKIVQTFRARMHPEKKPNNNFILGFPDQVYVTFYGSSFLYPVFKAVIENVHINYTDGRPNAFFVDGSPVTISLDISLQEVESLTREDFEQQQATTTGSQTSGVTNAN
jgi:hypothetical protein